MTAAVLTPSLVALVFMLAVMLAGWETVRETKNGGWTDVFWTFGTGLVGAGVALWPAEGADIVRQGLVAALVLVWSLRLGAYITARVATGEEDQRYVRLKAQWGPRFYPTMLGFLLLQAPITALLTLSIRAAAARPETGLTVADAAGLALLVVAIVGEGLADRQMKAFKRDPAHRGKVADTGLWAWSRHPNYFFEWLGWVAYPLIAIDLSGDWPAGWLSLIAPVAMYLVLTRLTGVPALEQHMLRTKGEAYAAYQKRTSAFFPLPPKERRAR